VKIEIFSRRNVLGQKRWYFRVRAGNGEIIAQSEGYIHRIDAVGTAHSMKSGMGDAEVPPLRDHGDTL
jgi:uncharacterized protein YegP (UPF0339 family)